MSVGVCGLGGLADDVRAASREIMDIGNVDFWEDTFSAAKKPGSGKMWGSSWVE